MLPALMSKLVCSSDASVSRADFPAHESTNEGGWDGETEAGRATAKVPEGKAFWELSCEAKARLATKANSDFNKRTKATDIAVQRVSTFVFVTPRKWSGKAKAAWRTSALSRGNWRDVRVYDADDLAAWIAEALPAQAFMATQLGRSNSDVCAPEDYWTEWAGVTNPKLTFAIFEQALEENRIVLERFLAGDPDQVFHVAGETREEATAFLVGLALFSDLGRAMGDRTVVVRTPAGLQHVKSYNGPITVIVASREVETALGDLSSRLHVLIPADRVTLDNAQNATIEPLTWDAFRAAASALGLEDDEARTLERESGRRVVVMRRRLAQVASIRSPAWADDDKVAQALVALALAGGWVWSKEADRALLAKLAGTDEENVERTIQALVAVPDAPIFAVGDVGGVSGEQFLVVNLHRRAPECR